MERRFFLDVLSGRAYCAKAVAAARRRGELRPASDFVCVDCCAPAAAWDHRDYNEPLAVEAVCWGCNIRRKSAKPRDWDHDEVVREYLATRGATSRPRRSACFAGVPKRFHHLCPSVFGLATLASTTQKEAA
jgi:hypothetical protein